MQRIVFVIVVGFFAVATGAATDIPAAAAESRDLRGYDDGGVYRGFGYISDVRRLREFIWTHWTQKRRGYVEVVFQGTDAGTQAYVFIEPVNGRWGVVWYDIQYSALPGSSPYPPVHYSTMVTLEHCRGSLVFFDAEDHILKFL